MSVGGDEEMASLSTGVLQPLAEKWHSMPAAL